MTLEQVSLAWFVCGFIWGIDFLPVLDLLLLMTKNSIHNTNQVDVENHGNVPFLQEENVIFVVISGDKQPRKKIHSNHLSNQTHQRKLQKWTIITKMKKTITTTRIRMDRSSETKMPWSHDQSQSSNIAYSCQPIIIEIQHLKVMTIKLLSRRWIFQ